MIKESPNIDMLSTDLHSQHLSRRDWTSACLGGLAGSLVFASHCSAVDASSKHRAIQRAVEFVLSKQSPDGAWRSEQYGVLRGGSELTPFIAFVLNELPVKTQAVSLAVELARKYLIKLAEGEMNFTYPVYSSAFASIVLDKANQPVDRLLKYLEKHRYGGHNGWKPTDARFGGWGYQPFPPRWTKTSGNIFPGPNLSATLIGLAALRRSGVAADEARIREIRQFVLRCQNFATNAASATDFDDGGFFFSPTDQVRNKAGMETASTGVRCFRSYGSTTADGLRALRLCGLQEDHQRVVAARGWLMKHFSATSHPGQFVESRKAVREAYYYYYCWSTAHALSQCEEQGDTRVAEIQRELMKRQRTDGSWQNEKFDGKEDDPLIATPLALAALHR